MQFTFMMIVKAVEAVFWVVGEICRRDIAKQYQDKGYVGPVREEEAA